MWSNVEVCSQWEQVTHTWRSGEERTTPHVQWGVGGDKQARTQVNRPRAQLSIYTRTYIIDNRGGLCLATCYAIVYAYM